MFCWSVCVICYNQNTTIRKLKKLNFQSFQITHNFDKEQVFIDNVGDTFTVIQCLRKLCHAKVLIRK